MSGAISPLPLCFMAFPGTSLPLPYTDLLLSYLKDVDKFVSSMSKSDTKLLSAEAK
jgi:hypothetical protein